MHIHEANNANTAKQTQQTKQAQQSKRNKQNKQHNKTRVFFYLNCICAKRLNVEKSTKKVNNTIKIVEQMKT